MTEIPPSVVRRITKELADLATSEDAAKCGISVELENDCITKLKGKIVGPSDTPYEGGNYILEIEVPDEYPFNPPTIRFVTKIWHPNISTATGEICLDILEGAWTPAMTLRTVLLSLQQLLISAEPDDPLNEIVAKQYKENPEMFKLTASQWAHIYAGAPGTNRDFENKIEVLKNMEIDDERALSALSYCSWDVERAVVLAIDPYSSVSFIFG